jgi:hypothetical protein
MQPVADVRISSRVLVLGILLSSGGCDTAADRSTAWSYIHSSIIRPSCTTSACHSKLGSQGGVDLSTPDAAYLLLTGHGCDAPEVAGSPPGNFVRPGHPEASELVYLLRGEGGTIMPPDVPLPDAEIEIIERWILEGAACD